MLTSEKLTELQGRLALVDVAFSHGAGETDAIALLEEAADVDTIRDLVEEVERLRACFPAPLSHAQTIAKRELLAGQLKKIRQAQVYTLPCAGCSRIISLTVARKCHWCGCWYCASCSDVHFGANPDKVRAAALAATEVPA